MGWIKSLGIRVNVGAAVAVAMGLGMLAGASGNLWVEAALSGVSVLIACSLGGAIGRALDALGAEAACAARTGVISGQFPETSSFADVNRLAANLNRGADAIHHSQADLDRANLQFIETMAQALDARDGYTAGHSLRVASYSYAIAQAMKVPEAEAQIIRTAAQLHDIGKIGVPDAVLQNPGGLTAEEFGLIKLHPQIGRRILEKMPAFQAFLPVVELHHENHNGTGYPYRLAGDRIPLAARIVHVADAFDAMVTHRHYRTALTIEAAARELRANAGTQFDPEIASVMLKLIDEGAFEDSLIAVAPPAVTPAELIPQ